MKKKIVLCICILLVIICLIPFQTNSHLHFEDGLQITYKAVLYEVEKVYRTGEGSISIEEYSAGTIVRIFGIEVYNSVR
ncbi:MAG: hypothetical protein IJB44_09285 [Clostridia bacterium]|nr:hypothetical protein [Clostridia bacterium]